MSYLIYPYRTLTEDMDLMIQQPILRYIITGPTGDGAQSDEALDENLIDPDSRTMDICPSGSGAWSLVLPLRVELSERNLHGLATTQDSLSLVAVASSSSKSTRLRKATKLRPGKHDAATWTGELEVAQHELRDE